MALRSLLLRSVIPAAIFALTGASLHSAAPQYQVDAAFRAPVFTAKGYGSKVYVMPDDATFVFSHSNGFNLINGQPYGSLLRFKGDGSHDTSFVLDKALSEYAVTAVAPAPDRKLVVVVRPMNRFLPQNQKVFRLQSDGTIDKAFDSGSGTKGNWSGQDVRAVAVDAQGRVIVAGLFDDFSGHGRAKLLRLLTNGALDASFTPKITAIRPITTNLGVGIISDSGLKIQDDGKILTAGAFSQIDGHERLGAARLNADGTVDTSFHPRGYNPTFSASSSTKRPVYSVAFQPDGKVLLGGVFNPDGSAPAQLVVRLNTDGAADSTFNAERVPIGGSTARSLKLLGDGSVVAASETKLVRYGSNGAADSGFQANQPTFGGSFQLHAVDAQSDGRVFCAGTFSSANSASRPGVARLNSNGTLDPTFNPGEIQRERLPNQLALRSDGVIVAGGQFNAANGVRGPGIALLKRDGTPIAQPFPTTPFAEDLPPRFFLQQDDKVLLFGPTRADPYLAYTRLRADGSVDPEFSQDPTVFEFESVLAQPDGRLLLSGGSSLEAAVNGEILLRTNPDGSRDTSFNPDFNEEAWVDREEGTGLIYQVRYGDSRALLALPDGRILFKLGGNSPFQLVWLDPIGARIPGSPVGYAEPHWLRISYPVLFDRKTGRTLQPAEGVVHPSGLGPITALRLPDGKIVLGGQFISYNGAAAGGIVRLNADGSFDSVLGTGAAYTTRQMTDTDQPSVTDIELERDGKLLVVGDFESFHGVPAPGIARLNADGSVDTTFDPPVSARTRGTALASGSVLLREGSGRFLLSGNYAATPDSIAATSIFRLEIPVRSTGMTKTSADALRIGFTGVPGETYTIQRSSTLVTGSFQNVAAVQAAADGTFIYEDATAFQSLQRFYRAVSPP